MADHKNNELECNIRHFWPVRSELEIIDGIAMKGKKIIAEANSTEATQKPHGDKRR